MTSISPRLGRAGSVQHAHALSDTGWRISSSHLTEVGYWFVRITQLSIVIPIAVVAVIAAVLRLVALGESRSKRRCKIASRRFRTGGLRVRIRRIDMLQLSAAPDGSKQVVPRIAATSRCW